MKITKKIVLYVEREGDNFICKSLTTLQLLMGTKSVSGNLSVYGIEKKGCDYIVPIKIVKERKKILEERLQKNQESLDIINQVLKI